MLRTRFGVDPFPNIRRMATDERFRLPPVDVVAAGFPCQDLSQCGRTAGIRGRHSGLIRCLFKVITRRRQRPRWIVIENVPFMLRLDGGRAMWHLTRSLERLGLAWAYRVVDARAFGLPQRRERVLLVASRTHDPRDVLFADEAQARLPDDGLDDRPRGFYWTEGNTGLGWAIDSVPTLKAGSGFGIPCPPAIWLPSRHLVVTPTIEDAEAMQGFPRGWTTPAAKLPGYNDRSRWRLVGNAVPVPMAAWLGERLMSPGVNIADMSPLKADTWPTAGFGSAGSRYAVQASAWPLWRGWRGLTSRYGARLCHRPLLSKRAALGFYERIRRSTLRTDPRFIPSLREFLRTYPTKCP